MSFPRIQLAVVPVAVGLLLGGAITVYRQSGPTPAAAAPGVETTVTGGGLIVSSDRLDFGAMEIGHAVARPLLLRNGGSDPMHVRIEAGGSGWTVEPAELTLEPGGVQRVQVIGTRRDPGAINGEIRILTDRSPEDALVVALAGGTLADGDEPSARLIASGNDPDRGTLGAAEIRPGSSAALGGTPVDGAPSGGRIAPSGAGVSITSDRQNSAAGAASAGPGSDDSLRASAPAGSSPIVPFDPAIARTPRSISERPTRPPVDLPGRKGEEPVPLPRPDAEAVGSESEIDPPVAGVSALVVSPSSTLRLLGTANQFYAQQISVNGSAGGGSFSLGSALQMPRIPLAFGQSMEFSQNGSAVGSYDPATGQVTMQLAISAIDSHGNSAPVVFSMTTGTIVSRNANGVLISVTGQPRSPDSGQLRLVGLAKIPTGFRNGAEEQLVTLDVVGSLTFAPPASARTASDAPSGGVQENL